MKSASKNLVVNIPFQFEPKEIDYILSGCFEGGSNYWIGQKVRPVKGDYKGAEFASEVISRGGKLVIIEDCGEGDKPVKHTLTQNMMLKGISLYAKDRKELNFDGMDSGDYDCILQYAIFGELKYS